MTVGTYAIRQAFLNQRTICSETNFHKKIINILALVKP